MTPGELAGVLFLLAVMPVLAAGLFGATPHVLRGGTDWQTFTTAASAVLLVVLTCVGANYVYHVAVRGTVYSTGGTP